VAGLIKREDIEAVRQRTDIKEVVDGYVTLRSAGIGSFKGLCPFHDERSPSFHVRPQVGTYHCFGCGESGDVISFVQKMDHLSFSETVEKLAAKVGIELRYEDGGSGPRREDVGKRQKLLDAHKIAAEFFTAQLLTPGAIEGRRFLAERGFDRAAAESFGVGFAPQGWDGLLGHLRTKGFRDEELVQTGMFSTGREGSGRLYDRFRGRLIWPIRDITGDVIGFGARKLFEDDKGPKYLNTSETPLYKKSQVLYGIDKAKRDIVRGRQLVVVEGYTDVMACHLAGVTTAVATCGTAFGGDHIKIVRRLLSDDGTGGEVVFTFDGDAAGQKAALRAFEEDQRFVAQTYVAVEPSGADPCELRQHRGDQAVKDLIASRRPLFEFAIRVGLKKHNLNTVEGRIQALREAAPIVARIRDGSLRPAYTRELAGWLGLSMEEVTRAVQTAARRAASAPTRSGDPSSQGNGEAATQESADASSSYGRPDPRDPVAAMERQSLEVALQQPHVLDERHWQMFSQVHFVVPAYQAVHTAIRAVGSARTTDPVTWVEAVREEVPEPLRALVSELAVAMIPAADEDALMRACRDILARLFELDITHQKADLLGQLQRMGADADPATVQDLNRQLLSLEMQRRSLRQNA